jgi:hypothetical protein
MEDLPFQMDVRDRFADVLPETLEEAEQLAASIERAVQSETGRGVADLSVEVGPHGVRLTGRCETYYTKQLAQHAAMRVHGGDRLINCIEVS